ncbi:MAG: hypothetical protein IPM82_22985 [Saprospiraceae bacterium]|nr:hypothetical protein [Saprospiraceae bacterium]
MTIRLFPVFLPCPALHHRHRSKAGRRFQHLQPRFEVLNCPGASSATLYRHRVRTTQASSGSPRRRGCTATTGRPFTYRNDPPRLQLSLSDFCGIPTS